MSKLVTSQKSKLVQKFYVWNVNDII